jgi:hypothetical protein
MDYTASNGKMLNGWWIGMDRAGSTRDIVKVLSHNFHSATVENKKTSVMIATDLADILTKHFSNMSLQYYH